MDRIETDYVIVGAGAAGMAFADTLLSETRATIAMVDRRAEPGGHWNDAYPFLHLHGPSVLYGVESRALGAERLATHGINRGLLEQASGREVLAYYRRLMRERFLPSGRVRWLPATEWRGGIAVSRASGDARRIVARRKLVDAAFADTRLPLSEPPQFRVDEGVRLVPPQALADLSRPVESYVILGGGKTAMDCVVRLLEGGVPADRIVWVRPRDSWLLPRENLQPAFGAFERTMGALAGELEAARDASSPDDLFRRLEASGLMLRIDRSVTPTMYRCAIVSAPEVAMLRRVEAVVRLGRVTALEPDRIVLERGAVRASPAWTYVNCTADGIPRRPPRPVFAPGRITLQYVRRCQPCFSAAFVAHVEASQPDDAAKNALCRPVPPPDEPIDWLRMHLEDAANRRAWAASPDLQAWLACSRLDRFTGLIARAAREPTPARLAILARHREAAGPALANIAELMAKAREAVAEMA